MINRLNRRTVELLRWSQQYTKTDMLYLAKGGGWLSLEKAITTLAGLGLAIAFANLIPEDTYGVYKYIVSVAGIIGALTLSGMKTAVIQAVSKGNDGALQQGFWEIMKWNSLMIVTSLGGALYYFINGNNTLTIGLLLIGIFYPILSSSAVYNSFLEGKKDFKRKSFYMILREGLQAIALVATMLLTQNILWILLVFFFINSIPALLLYFRTLKIYQPEVRKDEELVTYSKHLSVISVLNTVAKHIDKVLTFTFLGAGQLAIYSFATLPIDKFNAFNSILNSLTLPKFGNRSIREIKQNLVWRILLLFIALLIIALLFILVAPFIYELIFPQYLESVRYAQIFALSIPLLPGTVLANILIAHTKQKELYTFNITADVVKIILLLILLPLYGIMGAIAALLFDRLLKVVIPGYFVYKS